MNLMVNSIDAMKEVDGTRELTVNSQRTTKDEVLVSVSDTGVGLSPQQADQVFNAFFTTKPQGASMTFQLSFAFQGAILTLIISRESVQATLRASATMLVFAALARRIF